MSSVIATLPLSEVMKYYGYLYATAKTEAEKAAVMEEAEKYLAGSSTKTTAYVGQFRPNPLKQGGALSELEYFYVTGQKIGEDYKQTSSEAKSLSSQPLKLTPQEEAKIADVYTSLRYQSTFGDQTFRQNQAKLTGELYSTLEIGALRSQFEKQGLNISDETLEEYRQIKSSIIQEGKSLGDYTFPQFAYEKVIASKSPIEQFGIGLFSQQALGFYDIGKSIAGLFGAKVSNEMLDLLAIAQSYKPVTDISLLQGFAPFQQTKDIAYNIGVGAGIAIDIASLKSLVGGIKSYISQPKTLAGFLTQEIITPKSAIYRDIEIYGKRLTPKEFVISTIDPRTIPARIKGIAEDIQRTFVNRKTAIEKEVDELTRHMKASIKQTDVTTETKLRVEEGKRLESQVASSIRSEQGLMPKSNIIFQPRVEAILSKDITKATEDVAQYIKDVRQNVNVYGSLKETRERIIPKIELPKIELPKLHTSSSTLEKSDVVKQIKQDIQKDIVSISEKVEIKPKPAEEKPIKSSKSELVTVQRSAEEELEKLRKSYNEMQNRYKRYYQSEYEIVRYPPFARFHPPSSIPKISETQFANIESMQREVAKVYTNELQRMKESVKNIQDSMNRLVSEIRTDITTITKTRQPSESKIDTTMIPRIYSITTPKLSQMTSVQLKTLGRQMLKSKQLLTSGFEIPPKITLPKFEYPYKSKSKLIPKRKGMITEIYTYKLPSDVERLLRQLQK